MKNKNNINFRNKTRDELIVELGELKDKYDLVQKAYEKHISYLKLAETSIKERDGTKFQAEVTSNVFKDASGNERTSMIIRNISEQKNIERELRLHSEIMKNITEGFFLVTLPLEIIVFTNSRFDEMFGYEKGELLGKHVSVVNAPTDKSPDETKREIIELLNRDGEWHGEVLNIKKNGVHFWCYANVSIFDHPDFGRVSLSVHSDITGRKEAERLLKENEARFRSLFENSFIGIANTTIEGKLLQANLAFARIYGYSDEVSIMNELPDVKYLFVNPKERSDTVNIVEQKGFVEPMEVEAKRRDGSVIIVLVSAQLIRNSDDKPLYIQTTHLDLTERRRTEEKVRESALYARNLIEASIDPFVTINADGKIMDVNNSTEQITGITSSKLIGTDFADYFTNPEKASKGYKTVFSKGVVKDYPLTILHSSGRKINVLYNATLFKNEAGEVQGVFAAARDITDRKKMDEELRRSKKLLEKLNKHLLEIREDERSQIGLNLHDDLGQKLTAINLNITWIKSRIGVQSKAVRERIKEISEIINESIESIREISSFLRPNILFDFGLVPAIKWQVEKFELQSGIKCYFHHESDEIKIDTSVALILFRILQESLTNIARHSEASIAEVTLRRVRNKIEMLIKDNGIGIDKEKVNSLESLGIAGIKERIRSVGGSLLIKGEKGFWTFVKVSVPLKKRK